ARLLCAGGNVIVLDEPTNDLDLASLRALEDALLAFPGAAIVVSHDRWFLDRVATRIVHLDGEGHARVHEGDLSLLIEKLQAEAKARAEADARSAQRDKARAAAQREAGVPAPRPKRLSTREQRELAELPERIERLEAELAEVDAALGDPSLYGPANAERCEQLTRRRQELPDELAVLYARWEQLEAIAEQARG
ncbi:MAG TPA: ABC transporter ATP-binding protein, partial [bacterium]|nr:ABC transporter ATP-binding protein [bacterium]